MNSPNQSLNANEFSESSSYPCYALPQVGARNVAKIDYIDDKLDRQRPKYERRPNHPNSEE